MPIRNERSVLIDQILKIVALGGLTMTVLLAPNAVQILEKPLKKYFKNLDARQQEREIRKLALYMRNQRLITDDYSHGLQLTDKAKKRLAKADLDNLAIMAPERWDKKWRLVFYDIPEKHKTGRNMLIAKLKSIGFYQIQRSVWVHPFPCKDVIEAITANNNIDKYVTYAETTNMANEAKLKQYFSSYKL